MLRENKSMFAIMIITIISKILGFTREITLASLFGTTAYTDAYLVAVTIPMVIFVTFGGAMKTAFVPLYTDMIENKDEEFAQIFTNNVLNIVVLFTIGLSFIGIIFVKPLVRIFAVGFKNETLVLTIEFTKILLPGIVFIGINYILTAYLHANKQFVIPAFISIPSNVIIILCIFLSALWKRKILIYGTLLGMFSQLLIQLFISFRTGYRYKLQIHFKDQNIKRILYLVIPIFLGVAVNEINILIDRTLASTLHEGSIAALNFASKLNWFVSAVFIASIATVSYPTLSRLAAKGDRSTLENWINQSINMILIIVIPISAGAMCLSTPIVKILFERGAFDARATYMTSTALFYYSLGMIGFGLREIISKVFYALQDTKTTMINGIIVVAINIVLNLLLIKQMGHRGLALATSISSLVGTVLLFYKLKSRIGCYGERKCLTVLYKVCISTILMALGVRLFYCYISPFMGAGFIREAVSLFCTVLVGGFIYYISIRFLKVDEINDFTGMLRG